jgi:menaquinone-dependent protoporphyrinogen oxidase
MLSLNSQAVRHPTTSGGDTMPERVLVCYATMFGSTIGVANHIAEGVKKRGAAVDVMAAHDVTDIGPYSAIVVGSAIRAERPLPDAMEFLARVHTPLQSKRVSVFVVCMTMSQGGPTCETTASGYLAPMRALVKPAAEGLFAGVWEPDKAKWLYRVIMRIMKTPVGDFRNWEHIAAWAASVPLS